jgi:hypothetical protein
MLISKYSSSAHERVLRFLSVAAPDGAAAWSCPLRWCTVLLSPAASAARTYDHTAVSSTGPPTRSARPQALRRAASSKQATVGCRCAPRPPADRRGSGATAVVAPSPIATIRISSDVGARSRHPTQVRSGSGRARASEERGFVRPTSSESSGSGPAASHRRPTARSTAADRRAGVRVRRGRRTGCRSASR